MWRGHSCPRTLTTKKDDCTIPKPALDRNFAKPFEEPYDRLRLLKCFRQSRAGVPAPHKLLFLAHLHRQIPLVTEFLDHVHLSFQKVYVLFFIFEQGDQEIA